MPNATQTLATRAPPEDTTDTEDSVLPEDMLPEVHAKLVMRVFASAQDDANYRRFREGLHTAVASAITGTLDEGAVPFPLQLLAASEVTLQLFEASVATTAHAAGRDRAERNSSADLFRRALADYLCEAFAADLRKHVSGRLLELLAAEEAS